MKSNLYHKLILVAALLSFVIAACTKMDDTYKKFLEGGDIIYTAKADSIHVFPGRNRIKLSWLLTSDPTIVLCKVFWNNGADSVEIPIKRGSGVDTISTVITNLEEGSYAFDIYTYDKDGHSSVKSDTTGEVYGDIYASSLHDRVIRKAYWNHDTAFLSWYNADRGALVSELTYKDKSDSTHIIQIPAADTITLLPDFQLHDTIQYNTAYLPDVMAMDTFFTDYQSYTVDDTLYIPPPNLALNQDIDSKSSDGSSGRIPNIVDGDKSTFWQPSSGDRKDDKTVWVVIDLGSSQSFNELDQYWSKGEDHIGGFRVSYSDDKSTFQVAFEQSADISSEEKTKFPTVKGRYVKLELFLKEDGNLNVSEVEIYKR